MKPLQTLVGIATKIIPESGCTLDPSVLDCLCRAGKRTNNPPGKTKN